VIKRKKKAGEPVDLILLVLEEEQAKLMAHAVATLGDLFFQKSGVEGGGSGSTH
jgi:hypothetical protein